MEGTIVANGGAIRGVDSFLCFRRAPAGLRRPDPKGVCASEAFAKSAFMIVMNQRHLKRLIAEYVRYVSGGMRLVHCGGPIGAGPPEIDGGEPWPYSIKILDCWFFGDRVYRLAVEGAPSESFRRCGPFRKKGRS